MKTEGLMKGYKNRGEETKEFFTSDGFARMGDLGLYLADGTLKYIDRVKEIIKYNPTLRHFILVCVTRDICSRYENRHISPSELEDVLQSHPGVLHSMVVGKQDPRSQELPTAIVVPRYAPSEVDGERKSRRAPFL